LVSKAFCLQEDRQSRKIGGKNKAKLST